MAATVGALSAAIAATAAAAAVYSLAFVEELILLPVFK
jgi:hypothetical protein